MHTFLLEIVTPERITFSEPVQFLSVPAYDGELGVLAGHTPLLAQLAAGLVRFKKESSEETVAISGGFLEVHPDKTVVFAETAELAEEIDAERARQAAERAKSQLAADGKGPDFAIAEAALRRALIRLRASERIKRNPRL
jgi:F-type H+-transporting ATPase subunit epsilon